MALELCRRDDQGATAAGSADYSVVHWLLHSIHDAVHHSEARDGAS